MSSPRVQYRGDPPTESVSNSKVTDQNQERHDQVDESQQQRTPNQHQQQHYHFHPQHAQQQLLQQDQQQQQHHQQQHHQQQHHQQQHHSQHQPQQHDSNAQGYNNQSGSQYNVGPRAQCQSQHNGYSNPQSHPYDNRGRSNNGTPRIMTYNPNRQPQQYSNTPQAGYSDGNGSANNVNNFTQVNGSNSTHVTSEREGRGTGRFGAQGPTCNSDELGDQGVLQPPQANSHMNTLQAPMRNQGFNSNNQNTGQDMQGRSYGPPHANSGGPSSTSASSRGSYNVANGNNGQMRHSNTHSQQNYQCQQPQFISQEEAESQQQRHPQQAGTGALVRDNKYMRNIPSPMNEQRVPSDSITPEQNQGFNSSQGPGDIKYAHTLRAQPQLAIAAEAANVPQQQSQPPGSRGTEAEDASQNGSVSGRRRVSGYRLKTSVPSITTSQLPHHWRCNKALAVPFVVYSSEPIPDGTEVQVVAITSDGNQGELRNSNAYFRANVANFSGFRFVGRSGRGKAFRLILKFQTHPPMEAVLELKVKITVDGPRPKRARRLSEPSKAAEAEAWEAKELEKAKNASEDKGDAAAAGQAEDGHADNKSHHTGSHHTGSIHGNNVGDVYTNSPAKKMRPGTPMANSSRAGYPPKPGNSRNNTNIRSSGDPATAYENGMVNSGSNVNPGPHIIYAQNSNNPSHHSHAPSFDGNSQSNGSLRSQHSQPAERDQNRQDSSHGGSHGPQQNAGSAASCSSYAILQGLKLVSLSVTNGLEGDPITAVIKISESIVQQFGWSNMSYSVAFGQHPPVFTNPIVNNNGQMYYRFHAPAIHSKMTQLTALVKVANKQIYCGENMLMFEHRSNATPLPRKYGTVDSRGLGTEMLKLHEEFSEMMEQRQPGSNASPEEVAFLSKLCFEEDVMLQKFRESIMVLGQMRFLPPVGGSPDTSMTALHLAAEFGWQNFMGVLLDAGADLDQRDAMDFTAASYAYKAGQRALLEYLKSRDGYNHNFYKPQSQYRPPLEYQKQQQQLLQQQLEYEQQQQTRTNIQQRQTNEQQQQTMTQEMQQQRQLEQQQMQRQLDAQQQQQEQQLMALQQQQQRLNTQQEMQQKQQQQNDQVEQQQQQRKQQWEQQQQRMVPRGGGEFKPYEPDQPQQLQIGSSQQQQDQGQQQGLGPGQFQSQGAQQQMRSLDRLPSKGCQLSFDPGRQSQFDNNGQQQLDNNGQSQFDNNRQQQFDNNGQQQFDNNGQQQFDNNGQQQFDNNGQQQFDNNGQQQFDNNGQQQFDNNGQQQLDNNGQQQLDNNGQSQFDNNGQQGFGSRSRRQLNIGNQQQSDNGNQQQFNNGGQQQLNNWGQQQFNNRDQQQFNNRDQHQQQFDYAGQQQTPSAQQSFNSGSRPQYEFNSGLQPGQVTHLNQGGRACTAQRSNRASSDSCYSGYQAQKRPSVRLSGIASEPKQYVAQKNEPHPEGGAQYSRARIRIILKQV